MSQSMLSLILYVIVMVNPFAIFLYLEPVRHKFTNKEFYKIILNATVISFCISMLFFFLGNTLIQDVFKINFDSFRIFAGVVMFSFAYIFIIKGKKWYIEVKSKADDIAPKIALPFMVGAGTMSLTLLYSQELTAIQGFGVFGTAFLAVLISLYVLVFLRQLLSTKHFKTFFDRIMEILLRINGFFVGALWIHMIVTSIQNLFF